MSASKLTTIVAVDIAGYSSLSQADEEAAIAAVSRLGERCVKAVQAHGGRIFSTAGDAVMMEFTSVSGGLEAAAELAANPKPPIRIGVHLGEVSEQPNGDLLGHGVNVAARLQQQAHVGGVLVSEDARRALRGPLAKRLTAKGVIKLSKMDESIGTYELGAKAHETTPIDATQRAFRNARYIATVAVALIAAVVLAVLAWPLLTAEPKVRVAVFSPSADDHSELETLASGVGEDITLALTAIGVDVIARAETSGGTRDERLDRARDLGAALLVDGSTETDGRTTRITVAIIRTNDRATLWSNAFDGANAELNGLRQRAAEQSADVLSCGVQAVQDRGADMEAETFSMFMRICAARRDQTTFLEMRDTLTRVVALEPNFPFARALLALGGIMASSQAPESMRPSILHEARANAERARRADPTIGESYIALSLLEPSGNWEARERLLRQGLDRDELNGTLNNYYANLMYEVGHVSEALAFAQRGLVLDPLGRSKRRNVANLLVITGDADGARDIVEGMADAYPNDPTHWWARVRAAFWSGRYEDAIMLLDAPASQVRSARAQTCWRQAADAMQGMAPDTQGVQRVLACHGSGDLPSAESLMLLAALGDLDGAFAMARTMFVDERRAGHEILFTPATAAMRADPRFMPLMEEIGLLAYWRLSARWPDFCREPNLPYRCEAETERLR